MLGEKLREAVEEEEAQVEKETERVKEVEWEGEGVLRDVGLRVFEPEGETEPVPERVGVMDVLVLGVKIGVGVRRGEREREGVREGVFEFVEEDVALALPTIPLFPRTVGEKVWEGEGERETSCVGVMGGVRETVKLALEGEEVAETSLERVRAMLGDAVRVLVWVLVEEAEGEIDLENMGDPETNLHGEGEGEGVKEGDVVRVCESVGEDVLVKDAFGVRV